MAEQVWSGAVALQEHLVPVESIRVHPANPRRGRVALIAESLTAFGQLRPILLDGHVIVAGNHTYLAACELGWTHIAAIPNDFTDAEESAAYLLADNKLAEMGGYREEQRIVLLEELESTGAWTGSGYGPDDLEDLRALHGEIPEMAPQEFTGGFAATDEELAARAERLASGDAYKEFVLTLTTADAASFDVYLRVLRKEYGVASGVTESVVRAVAEQASK